MSSRTWGLCLSVVLLATFLTGCNNTLNPLCGSARPMPEIGSLSPSTVAFAQVQQGFALTINGSQFVSSSEAQVNGKTLAANVLSSTKLQVQLTTDVIAAPGTVSVAVMTPSGGSGDVGCSSGGTSTSLSLSVQ